MYILQVAFSLATKVKLEVNATWKFLLHLKLPFYQTHLYKLGGKPSQLQQTSHLYINFSDLSPIIYINFLSTKPSSFIHRKWKKKKNEGIIYCIVCPGGGPPGWSTGLNGSDMQPNTAEFLRERDNIFISTISIVLQQDQGTEALPLPIP